MGDSIDRVRADGHSIATRWQMTLSYCKDVSNTPPGKLVEVRFAVLETNSFDTY